MRAPLSAVVILLVGALAAGEARPNVLFIAIDDLNDWVGCLGGHPQAKTPHIDALARRGTLFTNAHCQAPLCNPSRTSVLFSQRPSTTGVYGLAPQPRAVATLKDAASLPQHFAAAGWRTQCAGKIFHGIAASDRVREFAAYGPVGGVGKRPQGRLATGLKAPGVVDWGVVERDDADTGDGQVAAWAADLLAKRPAEPFFLAAGFFMPHVPCYASQRWFDLHPEATLAMPPVKADDRADVPRFAGYLHWKLPEPRLAALEAAGQWRNLVRSYLAATSFVDHQIGRVLAALEAAGLAERTIVVLWSDHGWHLGEKGITGKNTLWERSTRVPLILAGPGVAAGARCAQPVELLDLYPTLIDLCRLPPRPGLEGLSLAPQLADAAAPRARPALTTHNQGNHAVRDARWRYIRYADGSEELYDHAADPDEWTNLAGDPAHAATKAALARSMPERSAPPAEGSAHRVLTWDGTTATWEGKAIGKDEALPE